MVFKDGFELNLIHDCLAHDDEQLTLLETSVLEFVFYFLDDFYLAVRVLFKFDQDSWDSGRCSFRDLNNFVVTKFVKHRQKFFFYDCKIELCHVLG